MGSCAHNHARATASKPINPVRRGSVVTNTTKSVVDRELEEDRNSVLRSRRASAARSAAGRPRKKINGSVLVGTSGTALTPEASVQPVCASGLKRSAFHAADGR